MSSDVRWLEVELEVPAAIADDFAAALFDIGAGGVQLIEETPLIVEEALPDAPPARTARNSGHTLLIATFEHDLDGEVVAATVREISQRRSRSTSLPNRW